MSVVNLWNLIEFIPSIIVTVLKCADRCPPCQIELRKLIERKQEQYSSCARTHQAAKETSWETPLPPSGWRLRGTLVAHLHEHRGAITRYVFLVFNKSFIISR